MEYEKQKPISEEQRRKILEEKIMMYQASGKRLESQIGFQAVLVTEKRPNHLIHLLLTIVTGGLWALIRIYLVLDKQGPS